MQNKKRKNKNPIERGLLVIVIRDKIIKDLFYIGQLQLFYPPLNVMFSKGASILCKQT